jgi:hypothetical protein
VPLTGNRKHIEKITGVEYPDLLISIALFIFSFLISSFFSNVFLSIIISLSFGFIAHTIFFKPQSLSITEHIIASIGTGFLTINLLTAFLVHLNKVQLFKESLLLLFFVVVIISFIKRKTNEYKEYSFNKEDIYPWILVLLFFFISSLLRHADFRFPDEYMYLNKMVGIASGGYISYYAQDRYFFHYTYSSILEFAPLTFRSVEIASLFFVSMSLIPAYLLGKEIFNKEIGYLAALFLAFNPSFIFNSIRLLPEMPLIFLITSFLYFFYKWSKNRRRIDFSLSCIFLLLAIFVKFHGVDFLGFGVLYILITSNQKDLKKNILYISILIVALFVLVNWNLHYNSYLILSGLFSRITNEISHDVIWVGYKAYLTFFAPDLYSMPFVLLFFFGLSSFLKEPFRKKFFLLIPLAFYVLFISLTGGLFGIGVRNFLVIMPLMSIMAAYGLIHRERVNRSVFWILLCLYLTVLAIMVIFAPKFPHLNFILPDLPIWIRILTFGSALAIVILMFHDRKSEKWRKTQYLIISLVIISSLLNANFFVNLQEGYPDRSKSGIIEAGEWLSSNTPLNSRIQSSTWELPFYMDVNMRSYPGMQYPGSTFLSYYTDRITYAPPDNDNALLERIKNKQVDYIVIFTDPTLTTSDEIQDTYKYLKNYINEIPSGTELIYTGNGLHQNVLFRIYKVI